MCGNVRLYKNRRDFRVNACRNIHGGAFAGFLPQLDGILRNGDGVKIDHAVKAVIVPLDFDPLLQGAKVITDCQVA